MTKTHTQRISPALVALALLALAFAAWLGVAAWQSPQRNPVGPIGLLFAVNLFRALLDVVVEDAGRRT